MEAAERLGSDQPTSYDAQREDLRIWRDEMIPNNRRILSLLSFAPCNQTSMRLRKGDYTMMDGGRGKYVQRSELYRSIYIVLFK